MAADGILKAFGYTEEDREYVREQAINGFNAGIDCPCDDDFDGLFFLDPDAVLTRAAFDSIVEVEA